MQPDLLGLEITKGELKRLTGVKSEDVIRASILQNSKKRLSFFFNELLISFVATLIIVGFSYSLIILPTIGSSTLLGIISLILILFTVMVGRWLWRKRKFPAALMKLLEQVDRYHAIIEAIEMNDQRETAETLGASLSDRTKVIEALQLTRADLVRALQAERILRGNKSAIATNPELFTSNLSALRAMSVNAQADEYGRILNEVVKIAVDVQAEMRKLKGQRLS